MEIKKITREDEAKLPVFRSHQQARSYFVAKYGDAFQIEDSFVVKKSADDATVIYRYALVLDQDAFEEGRRRLIQGTLGDEGASKFLASYQSLEVSLEGSVHVIH